MAKPKDYKTVSILPNAIKTHGDDRTWTQRTDTIQVGGGFRVSQEEWDEIWGKKPKKEIKKC